MPNEIRTMNHTLLATFSVTSVPLCFKRRTPTWKHRGTESTETSSYFPWAAFLRHFCFVILSSFVIPVHAADFTSTIKPFLATHCIKCHGPDEQEADLRLDTLAADFTDSRAAATWIEVRDKMNLGEMPPSDEVRPNPNEAEVVTRWIAQQLRDMQHAANSTGGRVQLRRLTRTEYVNTVKDLLKVTFVEGVTPKEILPPDGTLEGFDKLSNALLLDPSLMDNYFAAAKLVADRAVRIHPDPVRRSQHRVNMRDYDHGLHRRTQQTDRGIFLYTEDLRSNKLLNMPFTRVTQSGSEFPVRGRYIVRVKMGSSRGTRDEPVYVDLIRRVGNQKRIEVDASVDQPEVYEWETVVDPGVRGELRIRLVTSIGFFGGHRWSWKFRNEDFQALPPAERLRLRGLGRAEAALTPTFAGSGTNPEAIDRSKMPHVLVEWIEIDGPISEDFPPASMKYLFPAGWEAPLGHAADQLRDIVARLLPRAFRRSVADDEIDLYTNLAVAELKRGRSFDHAVKVALIAVLCSSDFLYLFEGPDKGRRPETEDRRADVRDFRDRRGRVVRGRALSVADGIVVFQRASDRRTFRIPAAKFSDDDQQYFTSIQKRHGASVSGLRSLSDHELATRLSYFLWSSMPDDKLFELAKAGRLSDPAMLDAQVERMLADPKAEALVTDFARQWLRIDEFLRFRPDEGTYRESFYKSEFAGIEAELEQEAYAFFREVLQRDESVLSFLDSDWVMANEKLAKYYGIDGVEGEDFRRVPLSANSPRGGLIGMAGVHIWGADGDRTKPVERGKYILSVLFNDPPDPPPPNAGEVQPNTRGERLTVRQRLLKHQEVAMCASCHRTIDPYGLALENFNAIGLWRDKQDGENRHVWGNSPPAINPEGTLPNGTHFTTFAEFKAALLAQSNRFERGLAEKLFIYALGRSLEPSDEATIEQIVATMAKDGHTLKVLIRAIIHTEAFQTK